MESLCERFSGRHFYLMGRYVRPDLRETLVVAEATRRSMQGNRGVDTGPERRLRSALWANGFRGYRKNVRSLPGKPDVVFRRQKVAIFVHGCYWHGCPTCQRNLTPKTNAAYWAEKIASNRERDARNFASLKERGFEVLVVWECEIKKELDAIVFRVEHILNGRP